MNDVIIKTNEPVDVIKFNGYAIEAKQLAASFVISNQEDEIIAVDKVKRIKMFAKEVELIRVEKKDPFLEMCNRIDAAFKPIIVGLKEAEDTIKSKINNYLKEIEKKRQEEEAQKQKEFDEAQLKALELRAFEGKEFDEKTGEIFMPVVPEIILEKTQAHGNYGTASQKSA
jgi:hypothetical protein